MKITRKIAAAGLALSLLACSASTFAEESGNNTPTGGAINSTNPLNSDFNNTSVPNGGAIYYLQE